LVEGLLQSIRVVVGDEDLRKREVEVVSGTKEKREGRKVEAHLGRDEDLGPRDTTVLDSLSNLGFVLVCPSAVEMSGENKG